jgi:AAA family ATP:ADP antiporter
MTAAILQRFTNIRRGEAAPALAAGLLFFCVLSALMVVRPAREALGMQRGIESVRWLFIGTVVVTLLVNPLFGLLVSRFRRLAFIGATYLFFAFGLLAFYALLVLAPAAAGERTGQVFYVWFSVFNLFATMLVWALMADRFSLEQSKRLFGAIAVGGTLGAIFGPWLASMLAKPLGTPALLLIAAGFLVLALGAAWWLTRISASVQQDGIFLEERSVIGGSAWEGFQSVFRSPYLLAICAYVLILAIMVTLLYFTRLQMVAALGTDLDARTATFARIDVVTQADGWSRSLPRNRWLSWARSCRPDSAPQRPTCCCSVSGCGSAAGCSISGSSR